MCISTATSLIRWTHDQSRCDQLDDVLAKYRNELDTWCTEDMTKKKLLAFFKEKREPKYYDCINHILSRYQNIPITEVVPYVPQHVEARLVDYLNAQLAVKKAQCCTHYGFILTKCLEAIGENDLATKHRLMFENTKWAQYEDTWARAFPHLIARSCNAQS
jgi:hypothetical protein